MVSKAQLGGLFLVVISIIIIFVIIYFFTLATIDVQGYWDYVAKLNLQLLNQNIASLLNGNALVNLPNINLVTNNPEIEEQQNCRNGAIYMGPADGDDYTQQCFNTCGNQGQLIEISDNDEYYSNGLKLNVGIWCVIQRAECNMKTGYVVATVNSVLCRTKYPNLFGGVNAAVITACNNEAFPSTGSVLWDYLRNEAVNPLTIQMTDEDEQLPDGSYRFQCKYSDDEFGNQYIPHPLNRFHPMRDLCNKTILQAARSVGVKITNKSWYCDCGDFDITRVKNQDPNDPQSTCTSCYLNIDPVTKTYQAPYRCTTLAAPYNMVTTDLPCNPYKFTRPGNLCDQLTLKIQQLPANDNDQGVIGKYTMQFSGLPNPINTDTNRIKTIYW